MELAGLCIANYSHRNIKNTIVYIEVHSCDSVFRFWCTHMAMRASVRYDGGSLPDMISLDPIQLLLTVLLENQPTFRHY